MIKTCQEGYDLIRSGIENTGPFFAGRSGATEAQMCNAMTSSEDFVFSDRVDPRWINQITGGTGIYPYTRESFRSFVDMYKQSCVKMQVVGSWLGQLEDDLMSWESEKVRLRSLDVIEPNPWTHALENKRVVVIHPFANTIKHQYSRRELWDQNGWCPEFKDLTIIQARYNKEIQHNGYNSWEEELSRIKNELQFDYDVALIGCGGIGAIVGAHVFDSGKKAVHMGGCLQLLFGIRGKRWESMDDYIPLMNDEWVRPFDEDKPHKFPTYSSCDTNAYF